MKFYSLEPEVAGGIGENTVMDNSHFPPIVSKLHYRLDGWLGDDLLESFPCYVISERLKKKLEDLSPSGCGFDEVEITKSEQFEDLYPNRRLPEFYWLKIQGKPGMDDFGISKEKTLIVSERVFEVLKELNIENCDIEKL